MLLTWLIWSEGRFRRIRSEAVSERGSEGVASGVVGRGQRARGRLVHRKERQRGDCRWMDLEGFG